MRMPSPELRNSLEEEIKRCQTQAGPAYAYLAERGINQAAADRFRLGHSGDTQPAHLANRLTIPYLTPAGPWHIKYRCIQRHDCKAEKCPKYIYSEGNEQHLFNAQALLAADRVIVTEGELDAVAVEQCGAAAVAYPGADTWAKNHHWAFCFDSVEEVIVVADGDEPGQRAARTVAKVLRDRIPGDVRTVFLPDGHDSNSFIQQHGDLDYLSTVGFI